MPDRFAFARKENCFATFAVAGHAAIRLVPNLKSSTRGCSRDANIGGFVHGASPQSSSRQAQNHMPSSFQSRDAGRHAIQANCWHHRFAAGHCPTHWSTRKLAAKPGISDTRCPRCVVPSDSGRTWSRLSKGREVGGEARRRRRPVCVATGACVGAVLRRQESVAGAALYRARVAAERFPSKNPWACEAAR
jgi:hypothetical protein